MDTLPQDIKRHIILSYLDDKSKRILRLASTSWFEYVKYDYFEPPNFPKDLKITQNLFKRLATYPHPILMHIPYPEFTNQFLEQLATLTNLISLTWPFNAIQNYREDANRLDWLILSTLTNLKHINYYCGKSGALGLLSLLTNITRLDCNRFEEDELTILKYATKLETLKVFDHLDWAIPLGHLSDLTKLTYLEANFTDASGADKMRTKDLPQQLERLTSLKTLRLNPHSYNSCQQRALCLSKLTALEWLDIHLIDLAGPCDVNTRLTKLDLHALTPLCATLSALTRLNSLACRVQSSEELNSLATLRGLTQLCVRQQNQLDAIPAWDLPNLASLEFELEQGEFDLATISKLSALRYMHLNADTLREQDRILGTLTNLTELSLFSNEDLTSTDFLSALINLEALSTAARHFTGCLTALTKLHTLNLCANISAVSLERISDLPNVTHLQVSFKEDVHDLQHLTKFDRLRRLEIDQLSGVNLALDALFSLPSLEYLYLRDLAGDCTCKDWSQISQLTRLTDLHVSGTALTRAHVAPLTNIKSLYI